MKTRFSIEEVSQEFFDAYMAEWYTSHGNTDYRDLWLTFCMGGEL